MYRAPKSVLEEAADVSTELGDLIRSGQALTLEQVVSIRDSWDAPEGKGWATHICDTLTQRVSAVIPPSEDEEVAPVEEIPTEETTEEETTEEPNLGEELSELLADTVTFYLRAHGAHWNIMGPDFAEYHALFASIYEDVYGSVDPLAENLRKIGVQAPFQMEQFISLRSIDDGSLATDAKELALGLLAANDVMIETITDAFTCASMFNEQGIANFLADRLDAHQMWRWQLSSSLGVEAIKPTETVEEEAIEEDATKEATDMEEKAADMALAETRKALATAERITMQAEVRAMDTTDGSLKIGGYAATFNAEATGLNFREVIAPGAFKRSLGTENPVFLLVNHDTESLPLASTRSGTLKLNEDEVGLRMEADLDPSNPRAQELASALRRGDVDKMSFAFTVNAGGEVREEGLRTLTDLDLYEVSVVTLPAYDSTSVGMRSAQEQESLELRKKQLEVKSKQIRLRK